jgi:DNA-binding transcriptional regulator YhcF (GntR family)
MTEIHLDPADKSPPYEQIKREIIRLIADGSLPEHFRLPSIRQLAGDLGVAPNTVARAYRELEVGGFVQSRGRRGTSVVVPRPPTSTPADALEQAVRAARRDGLDGPTILAMVSRAIARS